MPVLFKLNTPVNAGTLTRPTEVSVLEVTGVWFSTTPDLAPIGAAELSITLTDPSNGWQETIDYKDSSVVDFFSQTAPPAASGATLQDVMAQVLLQKLVADGNLPPGVISIEG